MNRFAHARSLPIALLLILCTVSGCEKSPPTPPVVHTAPVLTRPFEDGYEAGFEKGKAAAHPGAKLPAKDSVEAKAGKAALEQSNVDERWQRGWVEGYFDGFRDVARHLK